jgi:uncharacterized membrane protein YGL010W
MTKAKEANMEQLTQKLMVSPLFVLVAVAMEMTKLAISGVDVRPLISALFDEVIPSLA